MFENLTTPHDVKREYKRQAFKVHPDLHPASEFAKWNVAMQNLNAAYHIALQRLDNVVSVGTDGKEHTYRYNHDQEESLINAVAVAIRAKLPSHVTVTIVGIYIWVEGLTRTDKQYHAALKDGGFRFHSKRIAWYWKPRNFRTHYNPRVSLDDLKHIYGAREIEKENAIVRS